MSSNITWYILEGNDYNNYNDYYYGDIDSSVETILNLQVWNNRYGTTAVDDIHDAKLTFQTLNIDDSFILDHLQVKIDEGLYSSLTKVDETRGYVLVDTVISGAANNGLYSSQTLLEKRNVVDIMLKFEPIDYKINEAIRNLIITLEY